MAMNVTGSDRPSTLGGSGWRPREASHEQEVAAGTTWARCGYRSEVARLRAVLLAEPPDTFDLIDAPGEQLMLGRVDLAALRDQADAVAAAYRRHGVEVHAAATRTGAPPNVIFMRDLFLATPAGVVLARPAAAQRAGEERHAAAALAGSGIAILRTCTGHATFEGADAMWLDPGTVVVGTGFRTNDSGAATVRAALAGQGVTVLEVPVGTGVQHLLGAVTLIDERLAAVRPDAVSRPMVELLRRHGHRIVEFGPDEEVIERRGMNLVALAPGQVLMPAGCPGVRRRLERAGVAVECLDVSQYVLAGGALGCLTGIVRRDG
jgi:N-dimethylarginine dimethylaminohydrolase